MKNKYILTGHDILTLDVSMIHVPPNYILRCVLNLMVILTFILSILETHLGHIIGHFREQACMGVDRSCFTCLVRMFIKHLFF